MIVDCHGHYTTAPASLWEWRKRQVAGQSPGNLNISDREIRDSLEGAQLRIQGERGTNLTFFSPRAGSMEHPVGVVTALAGAPFFVILLRRLKRSVF